MSTYNFQATIASCGYHVYKQTTWSNVKLNKKVKINIETNQSLIAIDPHACAEKAKEKHYDGWKTVSNIPREVSRYIYFFIQKGSGKITDNLKLLNYKPILITSGGPEIPPQLTFSCLVEWVRDKMKDFTEDLHSYDFTGILHNDERFDDSNIEIDLVEDGDEEEADKMKSARSVVDKEITNILIQQEAVSVVTDADQISFILKLNINKMKHK